jgi:hypothetical protein
MRDSESRVLFWCNRCFRRAKTESESVGDVRERKRERERERERLE